MKHCFELKIAGTAALIALPINLTVCLLSEFPLIAAGGVSLLAALVTGGLLWLVVRRLVAMPLQDFALATARLAGGDLTFAVATPRRDDIGRLQLGIREALRSVSGILRRVGELTKRVGSLAARVEQDSGRVADLTEREARAIADISASVEEWNATIRQIAENVEGLAVASEETAAAMEEMAHSIAGVGSIVHDLSAGVDATGSSLTELSTTIREVAAGSGELAELSDTTLAAVAQISASTRDIEQKVKESARLSERVTVEASTIGASSLEKTHHGMERIRGCAEKTAAALRILDGRSEEIGQILTVIDAVTDQTTLLALNAMILSAQAGEKGKGFSVVAEEMKGLAGRTSVSTDEIAALIAAVRAEVKSAVASMNEVLAAVAEGSGQSREAAASFGTILESARASSAMSAAIEQSTAEQARAAQLVAASVERVNTMAHRMAQATAEQSKGVALIVQATEKIRDASFHVRQSADQQTVTSNMIARAVEEMSDKSQHIAGALHEQQLGSDRICAAIEQIRDIPRQSKDIAFRVNRTLREVVKDVELIRFELDSFTLHDEEPGLLKFGIVPVESPVDMYKRYLPLARYLGARLGRKVELRVAPNFDTALHELGSGITALCSMTSMIYIEAQRHHGAETLATVMRNGKAVHHSVIVARAGSPIKTLADLKNGTFAFVDEKAAAGYVMPCAMLQAAGVELADLAYYNFTGAHDEVARAVLRGEFDAGGLMESTARKYRDQGLVILAQSEPVPEWNICCRGLEPQVKEALQAALLDLKETSLEGAAVLHAIEAGCSGFTRATDADHNSMRGMMKKIGLL